MATSKRERQKAARREKLERMQREARRRRTLRRGVIVAVVAAIVIGSAVLLFSGSKSPTTTTTTTTTTSTTTTSTIPKVDQTKQTAANALAVRAGCPALPSTRANNLTFKTAPKNAISATATYYAHVNTTAGAFVIKLNQTAAPVTVNSFIFLAQHKYFNCVIFHRVIPGFVIQGGDPTGTGSGGPGYTLPDEFPKAGSPTYPLYSVAMAKTSAPHSGGSQFFIVIGASGETLPPSYSLFGQVISGQNVVRTIGAEGTASGTPLVTQRMLTVTISQTP
ncbi:MAG TPA: peptidylprolyl isomerase [Acidimicrobiales bacterium]|nr:peptidylprolyl isomerase [Acidimicrobiales bacterium]